MKYPNIIFILADDMGYGDLSGLNQNSAFQTPNLDQIINQGIHFTDAHTSSSVCTPSRYSILTGRYCWRTYLKSGVIGGAESSIIENNRATLGTLAKKAEFDTACIGKWHLGWEWAIKRGYQGIIDKTSRTGDGLEWIDYSRPIQNGPLEHGFDYFYGISGSLDMAPFVYVENNMPLEEPKAWATKKEFCGEGPRMESLKANQVLEHLTDKAVDYIHEHHTDKPFFLYFPITAPHAPVAPAPEFADKSGINPYADFCIEIDHRVGQIVNALKDIQQLDNTLIIFTSDNGTCEKNAECAMLEEHHNHYCSHIYRGYKTDIWEGGHRVPFLMQWPEIIKESSICEQNVGVFDTFATIADIIGQSYDDHTGEDSVSLLPILQGQTLNENKRSALIHHSFDGRFAIRKGKWKLCRCSGSGGWSTPTCNEATRQNLPNVQLYNIVEDPSETHNLANEKKEVVNELTQLLHKCIISGRSTPEKEHSFMDEPTLKKWQQIDWLPEIPKQFILDD